MMNRQSFLVYQRYAVFAVLVVVVLSVYSFRPADVPLFSRERERASNLAIETDTNDVPATIEKAAIDIETTTHAIHPTASNPVLPSSSSPEALQKSDDPVRDAVRHLFRNVRVDPTERYYRDQDGKYFTGARGDDVVWKEGLGKKIVILDVDTRVPTGDNQILNADRKINWATLEAAGVGLISHGITGHYLYAMIHGYDYKYVQAAEMPGFHSTWIRPHLIRDMLPEYQFVVHMDADAVIAHPEVPLEWMFNRWGVAKNTSFAMPLDAEVSRNGKPMSEDSRGVPIFNAGLVITQNNKVTLDMLEAWADCTTEVRYRGCGVWKTKFSHEQRAFSEYIRYDYDTTPQTIVAIPCDDGLGYPQFKEHAAGKKLKAECRGNFIRHYTFGRGKPMVHAATTETMAQVLAQVLQKNLLQHRNEAWKKEGGAVRDGSVAAGEDEDGEEGGEDKDADEEEVENSNEAELKTADEAGKKQADADAKLNDEAEKRRKAVFQERQQVYFEERQRVGR